MPFLTEPEPARGVPTPAAPGIRRIVAPNPSPMTYWGTNTYLIDTPDGALVLDPGPDDTTHVAAILTALGTTHVRAIVLSHTHHDHVGAVPALRRATGAPVHAWHKPADPSIQPDTPLRDHDDVFGWRAIHTPGHASDHLCFAGPGGLVFSADHVMGWSTSVVGPPGGNMAAYFNSLELMLARHDRLYLPGHGPAIPDPRAHVQALLDHRRDRERQVLGALSDTPRTAAALTIRLYAAVDPSLRRAAERNVTAHLQKLQEEHRAQESPAGWHLPQ